MRPISPGVAAIVALAFAWALIMHPMGWGQTANYSQVESLARGKAEIDHSHWQTKDKAWTDGHFYSVKAPGLALLLAPVYKSLESLGARKVAAEAAANARNGDASHWLGHPRAPYQETGYSAEIAHTASAETEEETPIHWVLVLLGAVAPAVALLLGVRGLGDRLVPGYGTAAAITLGLGTILMTFASELFAHVIAATLGFAAFALLFRERQGPPRSLLVGVAGLLAGLAVTFEYPLGLVGVVLFFYALARAPQWPTRVRRAAVYAAGAVLGALPLLAFNWWALGSPLQFAYSDAVSLQGLTGHAELGLNDDGFFGITTPRPEAALDLLLASRGVLVLTPVLLLGVAGAFALRRGRWRAEANVILAVTAIYFAYNAGYWLPFGGGTPGPRFLIPALPFLGLGLAAAWRRWPLPTLALAIPSCLIMVIAAITHPLIGEIGTEIWVQRLVFGDLEHTVLSALGVKDAVIAIAPVLIGVVLAVMFAVRATPSVVPAHRRTAVAAVVVWALVSILGPTLVGDEVAPLGSGKGALGLVGGAALAAIAGVGIAARRHERQPRVPARPRTQAPGRPEPALGESSA